MFCIYCGKEIDNDSDFCTHCGMPVSGESQPQQQTELAPKQTPSSTMGAHPRETLASGEQNQVKEDAGTVLAEGEVIVRSYNCANVKGVAGYLTVTNKRLMFNATGGSNSSRYSQEVTLSTVSGFTLHRGTNYNWNLIIYGVLLVILGVILGGMLESTAGIIMCVVAAAVLFFLGIRPAFQIIVYANNVNPSPIHIGEGPKSIIGNSALFAFVSTPTTDTNVMISELGALVQDLQSMGDLAIEKWKNKD